MITFFSKKDRMGNVTVVPVREEKTNIWQEEIYEMCVDSLVSGNIPKPEVIEIFIRNIFVAIVSAVHYVGLQLRIFNWLGANPLFFISDIPNNHGPHPLTY